MGILVASYCMCRNIYLTFCKQSMISFKSRSTVCFWLTLLMGHFDGKLCSAFCMPSYTKLSTEGRMRPVSILHISKRPTFTLFPFGWYWERVISTKPLKLLTSLLPTVNSTVNAVEFSKKQETLDNLLDLFSHFKPRNVIRLRKFYGNGWKISYILFILVEPKIPFGLHPRSTVQRYRIQIDRVFEALWNGLANNKILNKVLQSGDHYIYMKLYSYYLVI